MKKIIIIGAGFAGTGAAYRFYCNKIQATIYEKNSYPGGNAASFSKNGFVFDQVPQLSLTKNERIQNIFHHSVNHKVESIQAKINNYWKGHWIKHPVLVNLCGLPKEIVARIIKEYFESNQVQEKLASNFKELLYSIFGKTFTETFPEKYALKYYTTSLKNINLVDIKQKFYHPSFTDVLLGAISKETKDTGDITQTYYPSQGGFLSFTDNILAHSDIKFHHKIKHIDAKNKLVVFDNGEIEKYDYIISSMPIPELVNCILGVPERIKTAANKLAYTSCVVINISVNRANISKVHQTYFYDHNIIFSKLTFPSMLSPNNSPKGHGTIQAEIYFSEKYKPLYLPAESFIEPTISGLKKCGLIKETDKIVHKEAKLIPYANIIFDFERRANLSTIHEYLDDINIEFCGRYGDWENEMTDEAFISGENAAQRIINKIYSKAIEDGVSSNLSGYVEN